MAERSKGKMRPSLVRGSDLRETAAKPSEPRGPHGHFAAGNRSAVGARLKHTIAKSLGSSTDGGELAIVASDAKRIYLHVLRSFASDAAPVRVLVSIHARHAALHGYYTHKAEEAGLTTPAGLRLLEVADRQSQRAERVLVSAQDMARVCAASEARHQPSAIELLRADAAALAAASATEGT